jgi:diphthine synthase
MLILVGSGLRESQLTREAEEAIKGADIVIVETYTMPSSKWLPTAIRKLNSNVREASRSELEEQSSNIVELASKLKVVIVVPGDPLIATTHSSLVVESLKRGVEAKVVSGISGPCSVESLLGLHFYKFGRTVTVPGPWRGVGAEEAALGLLGNLCHDLHTLLLLDVSPEGLSLSPSRAVKELKESLRRLIGARLDELMNIMVLLVSVGENTVVKHSTLDSADSIPDLDVGSLVVPSKLHVSEREFLRYAYSVPEDVMISHNRLLQGFDACSAYTEALRAIYSSIA